MQDLRPLNPIFSQCAQKPAEAGASDSFISYFHYPVQNYVKSSCIPRFRVELKSASGIYLYKVEFKISGNKYERFISAGLLNAEEVVQKKH